MSEPLDPHSHHRRSFRLKDYDYTNANGYFVTICTHDRICLLGEVVDGEMRLSEYGKIARDEWLKTASVRPHIALDAFVIMPNHLHGILMLTENVGATRWVALGKEGSPSIGTKEENVEATPRVARLEGRGASVARRPTGPQSASIGAIIGQFKSIVTKRINERRGTPGLPVWQRNYYEHVLREGELDHIREYIQNNPIQWEIDSENPARHT